MLITPSSLNLSKTTHSNGKHNGNIVNNQHIHSVTPAIRSLYISPIRKNSPQTTNLEQQQYQERCQSSRMPSSRRRKGAHNYQNNYSNIQNSQIHQNGNNSSNNNSSSICQQGKSSQITPQHQRIIQDPAQYYQINNCFSNISAQNSARQTNRKQNTNQKGFSLSLYNSQLSNNQHEHQQILGQFMKKKQSKKSGNQYQKHQFLQQQMQQRKNSKREINNISDRKEENSLSNVSALQAQKISNSFSNKINNFNLNLNIFLNSKEDNFIQSNNSINQNNKNIKNDQLHLIPKSSNDTSNIQQKSKNQLCNNVSSVSNDNSIKQMSPDMSFLNNNSYNMNGDNYSQVVSQQQNSNFHNLGQQINQLNQEKNKENSSLLNNKGDITSSFLAQNCNNNSQKQNTKNAMKYPWLYQNSMDNNSNNNSNNYSDINSKQILLNALLKADEDQTTFNKTNININNGGLKDKRRAHSSHNKRGSQTSSINYQMNGTKGHSFQDQLSQQQKKVFQKMKSPLSTSQKIQKELIQKFTKSNNSRNQNNNNSSSDNKYINNKDRKSISHHNSRNVSPNLQNQFQVQQGQKEQQQQQQQQQQQSNLSQLSGLENDLLYQKLYKQNSSKFQLNSKAAQSSLYQQIEMNMSKNQPNKVSILQQQQQKQIQLQQQQNQQNPCQNQHQKKESQKEEKNENSQFQQSKQSPLKNRNMKNGNINKNNNLFDNQLQEKYQQAKVLDYFKSIQVRMNDSSNQKQNLSQKLLKQNDVSPAGQQHSLQLQQEPIKEKNQIAKNNYRQSRNQRPSLDNQFQLYNIEKVSSDINSCNIKKQINCDENKSSEKQIKQNFHFSNFLQDTNTGFNIEQKNNSNKRQVNGQNKEALQAENISQNKDNNTQIQQEQQQQDQQHQAQNFFQSKALTEKLKQQNETQHKKQQQQVQQNNIQQKPVALIEQKVNKNYNATLQATLNTSQNASASFQNSDREPKALLLKTLMTPKNKQGNANSFSSFNCLQITGTEPVDNEEEHKTLKGFNSSESIKSFIQIQNQKDGNPVNQDQTNLSQIQKKKSWKILKNQESSCSIEEEVEEEQVEEELNDQQNQNKKRLFEKRFLRDDFCEILQEIQMDQLLFSFEEGQELLSNMKKEKEVENCLELSVKWLNSIQDSNCVFICEIFENFKANELIQKQQHIDQTFVSVIKNIFIYERVAIQTCLLFFYFNKCEAQQDIHSKLGELVVLVNQNQAAVIQILFDLFDQSNIVNMNWDKLSEIFCADNSQLEYNVMPQKLENQKQEEDHKKLLHIFQYFSVQMIEIRGKIEAVLKEFSTYDFTQFLFGTLQQTDQTPSIQRALEIILENSKQFSNPNDATPVQKMQENKDTSVQQSQQQEKEVLQKSDLSLSPYLPPIDTKKHKYTLVLDLDETLVHYVDKATAIKRAQLKNKTKASSLGEKSSQTSQEVGYFLVRPYAEDFLLQISKMYEIVIFTAAMKDYADWILNLIDPQKVISHRLYREHCTSDGKSHSIKDLSKLGRDLSKILIVDNLPENFINQRENGIAILSWFGEETDCALLELHSMLTDLAQRQIPDVRAGIQEYQQMFFAERNQNTEKKIRTIITTIQQQLQNLECDKKEIKKFMKKLKFGN